MIVKFIILIILCSCNATFVTKKVLVPQPQIKEYEVNFKKISTSFVDDKVVFNKENFDNLIYNIKMSKLYHSHEKENARIIQEYYQKVVLDLGGELVA